MSDAIYLSNGFPVDVFAPPLRQTKSRLKIREMIAKHVFYEGRVQGVGFRYTVRQIAKEYEVTGWVRNLIDGRVELLVSGEADEVDGFLETIAEGELAGFIKGSQEEPAESNSLAGLRGFEIRP
jgi:acylphosphatase